MEKLSNLGAIGLIRRLNEYFDKFQFGEQPKIHRRAQLYALCQCIAFVGAHTQMSIRVFHRMLICFFAAG